MSWSMLALAAQTTFGGPATVVDGDTLQVGRERVRLLGIDAPELSQMCDAVSSKVACGQRAAQWLRSRVQGRRLQCSAMDRDRYGRVVASCTIDGVDLGRSIVDAGWATAYRKYSTRYVDEEGRARAARRGVWALGFERPEAYRRARTAEIPPQVPPDPHCVIKGNVSSKGVRIYHLPGSRDYAAVRIDAARGERWFCGVAEATRAGWRPAR